MVIKLNKVHIGEEIKKRLDEKKMSKSEFARRIGAQQQHINRVFEKDTIETKRLVAVSEALDFNFFSLFCDNPNNVFAYLAAVSLGDGNAINLSGDAALLAQIEVLNTKISGLERERDAFAGQIESFKRNVEQLESNLRDKDEIISLIKQTKS